MKSDKLREVVGRMTRPSIDRNGLVVQVITLDRGPQGDALATLANHATVLVELVAACEEFSGSGNPDDDWKARRAIIAALDKVHAIGADHA